MPILRDGTVKTRKPHKCHGCLEVIPKGSTVYSQTAVDDGIYTLYMCDACIKWCNERNCKDCMEDEEAHAGYVKECKCLEVES